MPSDTNDNKCPCCDGDLLYITSEVKEDAWGDEIEFQWWQCKVCHHDVREHKVIIWGRSGNRRW